MNKRTEKNKIYKNEALLLMLALPYPTIYLSIYLSSKRLFYLKKTTRIKKYEVYMRVNVGIVFSHRSVQELTQEIFYSAME